MTQRELRTKDEILDVLTGVFALTGWTYGYGWVAERPGREGLEKKLDYLIQRAKENESGWTETGRILTRLDSYGTEVYLNLGYLEEPNDE